MTIRFECPECHEAHAVIDELAGLKRKCKNCKVPLTVPQASDPAIDPPQVVESPSTAPSPARRAKPALYWFYLLLAVISVGVGLARFIHRLNQPTEEEVQRRMQEGYAEWQRQQSAPTLAGGAEAYLRSDAWKTIQADHGEGEAVVDAFLLDLRENRIQAARARTTVDFKARQSENDLAERVRQFPALQRPAKCLGSSRLTSNGRLAITYAYRLDNGDGEQLEASVVAVKQGSGFAVDALEVRPVK